VTPVGTEGVEAQRIDEDEKQVQILGFLGFDNEPCIAPGTGLGIDSLVRAALETQVQVTFSGCCWKIERQVMPTLSEGPAPRDETSPEILDDDRYAGWSGTGQNETTGRRWKLPAERSGTWP
jgi:hypothetical protein